MIVVENKTGFKVNEIIKVAKRKNNNKRSYLFVNPLQAKHIPVCPDKTIRLFNKLGKELYDNYKCKKVGVIGFAETATAIGLTVASAFDDSTFCIHTTREIMTSGENILKFEEGHSHAPNQSLYFNDKDNFFEKSEIIILVEDEVSTGKTVLNLLSALKEKGYIKNNHKIVVASLINAMDKEDLLEFKRKNIEIHFLLKINYDKEKTYNIELQNEDMVTLGEVLKEEYTLDIVNINGKIDSRVEVPIKGYLNSCDKLSSKVLELLNGSLDDYKNILVLGTEEFMYIPIIVGRKISNVYKGIDVKVHATTRSPIMIYPNIDYPINNCSELKSFYCKDRQTYIYNLARYDKVIIITDSEEKSDDAFNGLAKELSKFGCKDILGIRWVK